MARETAFTGRLEPGRPPSGSSSAAPEQAVTHWRLFHFNRTIWPAVFDLCEEARETLTIEQYIFAGDGIGERLMDLLAGKARQGVRVRVLADGYGSRGLGETPAGQRFRRRGGELVYYHPLSRLARHPIRGLNRLHRKSVIRDGRAMMVGGACFTDKMANWRDTMARVEGAPVATARAAFETAWAYASGQPAPREEAERREEDGRAFAYVTSEPVRPVRQQIYTTLLSGMRQARRVVTLTTPYLVPDPRMWRALADVLSRGVRLRLLIPHRSDHPAVDVLSRRFAAALARRGAEVHAYEPAMIHAKIALIDEEWACVSSFNLDILSIWLNVENGLAGGSGAFHDALAAQFDADIAVSRRL